jgi:hypothetical protein
MPTAKRFHRISTLDNSLDVQRELELARTRKHTEFLHFLHNSSQLLTLHPVQVRGNEHASFENEHLSVSVAENQSNIFARLSLSLVFRVMSISPETKFSLILCSTDRLPPALPWARN